MPKSTGSKRPLTATQKLAIARKRLQALLVGDLLAALFTNGVNEKAQQLRMHNPEGRYIGGWSIAGAERQIKEVLKKYRLP